MANHQPTWATPKIIDVRLSNNSVAAMVNKVEQQKEQDAQQSGKLRSLILLARPDSSSSGGGSWVGPLPEGLERRPDGAATLTTMQTPVAFRR